MFTSKHFINIISSFLIGLISLIFVYRYSLFFFNDTFLLILIYILLFIFVILSFDKIKIISKWGNNNKYYVGAILLFILLLLYYSWFTSGPYQSFELLALKNWLNNFFNWTFPYQIKNTFSAFPFLYLIASPFYFIGNVAMVVILAWGGIGLLIIFNSTSTREKVIKLFFLMVSPLTFYGPFESPQLFLNAAVLLTLIYLSNKYLNPAKVDKTFVFFALLFGLFFSVTIDVVAVLIIYFLYLFRNNFKEGFLFYEVLLAVFLVTIIPFLLWNPVLFLFNGPFNPLLLNSIPWLVSVLFIILIIYAGWMISDIQEIYFAIGVILTIPYLIYFLYNPQTRLANFIFPLPFLIFSIKDYTIEKFSGRMIEIESKF